MEPCIAARKDSAVCHLAAETLRASGSLRLRATGSSMLPAIRPGDILHLEHREIDQVRVGQIAALECYGRMVIHRVIKKTPAGLNLITCGDSLPTPDPPTSGLLGVVVNIERDGKVFRPAERLTRTGRLAAAALGRWPHAASLHSRIFA